ncbi:MAG: hypothetical protein IPM15_13875 [Betaproteobacteria bacterium]|nr:hypothetical protein [Betaproteobacteria bacterium]
MKRMLAAWAAIVAIVAIAATTLTPAANAQSADPFSDAPEGARPAAPASPDAAAALDVATYDGALARWRSAAHIEAWLGQHFRYDTARAARLSETQRQREGTLPIIEPPAFFARPSGVCVDVARFGVETLRRIAPGTQARYLMIEFDPVTLSGQTLRRHWVAVYEADGRRFFFADSKRPGLVAGPYADTAAFIADYARYRGRRIVAFQERDSFERQQRLLRRAAPAAAGSVPS